MRLHLSSSLAFAAALALAACSGDDAPPSNPPRLWLSLVNGDETRVQLVPVEPDPF